MMKKILVFQVIFVFLAIFFTHTAFAQELPYVRTVFNERSGLPTGEANDVLQTSDGYV